MTPCATCPHPAACATAEHCRFPVPPQASPSESPVLHIHWADYQALLAGHDARVTELLEANNREVERRRKAEAALRDLVENERRDSLNDPDMTATDMWREKTWDAARAALAPVTP